VGNAAVNMAKSFAQLPAIGTIFDSFSAFSSFIDPVSGIVSAGMGIFNALFGGPSQAQPTAQILNAISRLSSQLTAVQRDMDAQFAGVNSTLSTIISLLSVNFTEINASLSPNRPSRHPGSTE
jgi:hypothetical protein